MNNDLDGRDRQEKVVEDRPLWSEEEEGLMRDDVVELKVKDWLVWNDVVEVKLTRL